MEAIVSIAKAIAALMPFTSQFGLLKYICEQCTIFGIAWIDKTLFWIASALATGIAALVVGKTDLPGKAKAGISILWECKIKCVSSKKELMHFFN